LKVRPEPDHPDRCPRPASAGRCHAAGGYVHRLPRPTDRRSILVELTPTGREEVGTLFVLMASNVNTILEGMTPDQREAVAQFLEGIAASFERRGEETLKG
jgi:hypothetical protein